jgi:hypothetical protein
LGSYQTHSGEYKFSQILIFAFELRASCLQSTLPLEPLWQPFVCVWVTHTIYLISASWVARRCEPPVPSLIFTIKPKFYHWQQILSFVWLKQITFLLTFYLFYFILWYWGLNSGPTPWATPPILFLKGFFEIGSGGTICLSWLQTLILLISDLARITSMINQCSVPFFHFWENVCTILGGLSSFFQGKVVFHGSSM